MYRDKIEELRKSAVDAIKQILLSNNTDELYIYDISKGTSPILQEDTEDGNNTYILDKIYIESNTLYLDGSSSYCNFTWNEDNLCTEALTGVAEFLENYEEKIKEHFKSI